MILVTGGTGFLGSYVIRTLLKSGKTVRALRRADSRMDMVADIAGQVEWVEADVTDVVALEAAFEGITGVCHCAAMVSFNSRDYHRMMQINVGGTANMVNLAADFGVKRFVHVSSIAALGRTAETKHIDESAKWTTSKLNTQYAISKYQSEQEVWRAHYEGLPVAIVNPSMVTGSGFWNEGVAKMFTQLRDGMKFCPVGRSGFVDVRDVADFMVRLLDSDINGERYLLNAENRSYRDFFNAISKELGKPAPPITVTPLLAEVAWRVEWLKSKLLGKDPLVTRESARASVMQYTYGNEKSLAAFPGQFTYRPLDTTIAETAAQCLEAGKTGARASVLNC